MPVTYRAAAGGIPDVFVLLLPPNWQTAPEITYSLASEQVEGLTGIDERRPAHRALRIRQRWSCTLDESDAASLEQALAAIGTKRVAMPIWPDLYAPGGVWMHLPQYTLSWSDAGLVSIDAGTTGPFPYTNHAPLCVGRLVGKPRFTRLGGKQYGVDFEVREDSAYSLRIAPATGSTPEEFTWEPNWGNPLEGMSRDQLRTQDLGQGRESAVAGGNGTLRWGQEGGFQFADRADAASFLRFWVAMRGACDSFTVQQWGQPGAPTDDTPAEYQAVFAADSITFRYVTPTIIETTIKVWQEIETEAPQSGEEETDFFKFTWAGGSPTRLTSCERSLTYSGNTYTPAKISQVRLRKTLKPFGDTCDVEIFSEDAGNPLLPLFNGEVERTLSIEIGKATIDSAGTVSGYMQTFSGTVREVELQGDKLVGHCVVYGGIFRRKLPGFRIQPRCNYSLFSAPCGLAKGDWDTTGPIGGTLPGATVTFTPSSAPTGDYADKWYAGGWIEVTGTDGSFNRRYVMDCSESSGVWTLQLQRPLPATCSGQAATAYPGCDGNRTTCIEKFDNYSKFGGFPYVPEFIATSSGSATTPKTK
jgi:hypothetical protein